MADETRRKIDDNLIMPVSGSPDEVPQSVVDDEMAMFKKAQGSLMGGQGAGANSR